jgi:hypothetical protein
MKYASKGIVTVIVLILIFSTTNGYAETSNENGSFTAATPDGRSFNSTMPDIAIIEDGIVSTSAGKRDGDGYRYFVVGVVFVGNYTYGTGYVSGKTSGSYLSGIEGKGWERKEGEGEWDGFIDPETGIGKGTYRVNLVENVHPGEYFEGEVADKKSVGTIVGYWETKFRVAENDILKWYTEFGNSTQTWPDGTTDNRALISTGNYSGSKNNFYCTLGYTEYCRFSCTAIQWKTLYFLNQLKTEGKLVGWDYMPVDGWFASVYTVHNVVAIWKKGDDLQKGEGTILDAHGGPGTKKYYSANYKYWNWHPNAGGGGQGNSVNYANVYPGTSTILTAYNLKNFQYVTEPWNQPGLYQSAKQAASQAASGAYNYVMSIKCPVDVLVVNSKGERLGMLPEGELVSEFEPLDFYFREDEGEKQWFFALPEDQYHASITGEDSGSFTLMTGFPGKEIHDYGNLSIKKGEEANLIIDTREGEELTMENGSNPSFETVAVEQKGSIDLPGLPDAGGLPMIFNLLMPKIPLDFIKEPVLLTAEPILYAAVAWIIIGFVVGLLLRKRSLGVFLSLFLMLFFVVIYYIYAEGVPSERMDLDVAISYLTGVLFAVPVILGALIGGSLRRKNKNKKTNNEKPDEDKDKRNREEPKTVKCLSCSFICSAGSKFCGNCGARLPCEQQI